MSAQGFTQRPLPWWLRAANSLAAPFGGGLAALSPPRLMAAAGRQAGLPPEFPPHVHDALEVLCGSLQNEAGLHWFGVQNALTLLVTGLAAQLRIEHMFAQDPTLAEEPLIDPVVVIGLPRSGTTFLHRLLCATPDAVGVTLSEHTLPVQHGRLDTRKLEVKAKFLPWEWASAVYGLDAIHFVRPDLPDECNFGMRLAGRSMIYWATSCTPSYLRWLLDQDLKETYALYRKVLILHQRAHPGKRLTLKCPHHLAWMPSLVEALPEAHLVQTHRDPVQTVPSECSLVLSLQGLSTDTLDWRRTVDGNSHKVRTFAERTVRFADSPEGARIHHVDYKQLIADPAGLAREVNERAGFRFTEEDQASIEAFVAENRQHKRGRHRYDAAAFDLHPDALAEEFASYRERFILGQG